MNAKRKEAEQKFLNNLIQRTSKGELDWHCEQTDNIDPHSYFCVYPTRVQIDADPKILRAIDIYVYPDRLIAFDAWELATFRAAHKSGVTLELPAPILRFEQAEYPTHLDRLLELAETQRVTKNDEQQVTLIDRFFKGQN